MSSRPRSATGTLRGRLLVVALVVGLSSATALSDGAKPQIVSLKLLERPTSGAPAAYIRRHRQRLPFHTIDEFKAHVSALPVGSRVVLTWFVDPDFKTNPFFLAQAELRKFCAERGITFELAPAPFL